MTDRKQTLLSELTHAQTVVNHMFDQLTPEQWEMPVQEEDARWTARQVLVHLCDAVRGMTGQFTRIAAGEEAVPPDFDLNRWNRRTVEKSGEKTVAELRQSFNDYHVRTAQALESLNDAQLDVIGRHSSLNMMSVEAIVRLIGTHEINHARLIAEALHLPFSQTA